MRSSGEMPESRRSRSIPGVFFSGVLPGWGACQRWTIGKWPKFQTRRVSARCQNSTSCPPHPTNCSSNPPMASNASRAIARLPPPVKFCPTKSGRKAGRPASLPQAASARVVAALGQIKDEPFQVHHFMARLHERGGSGCVAGGDQQVVVVQNQHPALRGRNPMVEGGGAVERVSPAGRPAVDMADPAWKMAANFGFVGLLGHHALPRDVGLGGDGFQGRQQKRQAREPSMDHHEADLRPGIHRPCGTLRKSNGIPRQRPPHEAQSPAGPNGRSVQDGTSRPEALHAGARRSVAKGFRPVAEMHPRGVAPGPQGPLISDRVLQGHAGNLPEPAQGKAGWRDRTHAPPVSPSSSARKVLATASRLNRSMKAATAGAKFAAGTRRNSRHFPARSRSSKYR
jgi:hypothetical protein